MLPISHPPDAILYAYSKLIDHVFVYIRNASGVDQRILSDLGDAMHNVGQLIASYGQWVDDEKFRELYLRPFDERWGSSALNLEQLLDCWLKEFSDASR